MKLFVPDIGTLIRLEQDWQVTLYAEYRNRSLFDKLGLPYKTTVIDLPKGLVIKVDRIYIRKGLSQYSSLTFTCPKPKTKKEKELNPKNIDLGGAKFWIKLHECNGLSISNVISNEETVSSIKELYSAIPSKKIVEDLIKFGCVNKKSNKIKLPSINDNLYRHFIRGYFDGDGSISYGKNITLNFVSGSFIFLEEISSLLNRETLCKKANLVGKSNNYRYLSYNRLDDIRNIYEYLYNESTLFLERKKEKIEYIISNYDIIKILINKDRRESYDRNK